MAGSQGSGAQRPPALLITALVACLPDLDFLWGRHNMETHSLGMAVAVGVVVFAISRFGRSGGSRGSGGSKSGGSKDPPLHCVRHRAWRLALACTLAWASHVLFDWLGSDDSPPLGVMALWPVTSDFYFANAFIFEAISRRHWLPGFLRHNLLAIARELLILLPPTLVLLWWRRPRH